MTSNNTTTKPLSQVSPAFITPTAQLGWFSNKHNQAAGWYITGLDKEDTDWLEDEGVNTSDVFRTYHTNDPARTNLARFNFKTGTYAFMDGDYLLETDKIRFEKMTRYRKAILYTG